MSISKRISIVLNINDLRQISALLSSDFLIELEKLILSQVINRIKYSGCGLLKIIFYCVSYPIAMREQADKTALTSHGGFDRLHGI